VVSRRTRGAVQCQLWAGSALAEGDEQEVGRCSITHGFPQGSGEGQALAEAVNRSWTLQRRQSEHGLALSEPGTCQPARSHAVRDLGTGTPTAARESPSAHLHVGAVGRLALINHTALP
jgi:hypothetical protein